MSDDRWSGHASLTVLVHLTASSDSAHLDGRVSPFSLQIGWMSHRPPVSGVVPLFGLSNVNASKSRTVLRPSVLQSQSKLSSRDLLRTEKP
jgi:hypothetical protein